MTENKPMMACGHRANATSNGEDCCVICAGISPGYKTPVEEPNLSNRQCKCAQCGKVVPSLDAVAFFEYRPTKKYDDHYDGCRGWG